MRRADKVHEFGVVLKRLIAVRYAGRNVEPHVLNGRQIHRDPGTVR